MYLHFFQFLIKYLPDFSKYPIPSIYYKTRQSIQILSLSDNLIAKAADETVIKIINTNSWDKFHFRSHYIRVCLGSADPGYDPRDENGVHICRSVVTLTFLRSMGTSNQLYVKGPWI